MMESKETVKGSKRTKATALILAVATAAAAAHAASVADEIKELKDTIASNRVTRVADKDCRLYCAWYVDECTPEEREAILERNIAAHRRWIELEPGNPVPHAGLADVFATVGRWKEAKPELEAALAARDKLDARCLALALWEMANCLWVEGDRDGAKKLVDEVAAMYGTGKVSDFLFVTGQAKYVSAMFADSDGDLDMLKLPHSVDCKPFPNPQSATYGEGKVSLAKVEVVTGSSFAKATEDKREDPIVRLLKKKLARFGSKFEKGGTKIEIEISPNAPVDKPQGYELRIEGEERQHGQLKTTNESCPTLSKLSSKSINGRVSIKARDRLGATWGVVSLLQCVERRDEKDGCDGSDEGRPSVRECAIRDWPRMARRGMMNYWKPEHVEYALFNKMSSNTFIMGLDYTLLPLDKERFRLFAKRMRDFGIETYFVTRDIAMRPNLPFSSPRTWKLHLKWAKFYASIGAGNSFQLDDFRFPLHPRDTEKYGTGANMDAKYMTRLYREVKAEYPDHFMQFCPPFYFGPDGGLRPDWYPEPRDAYLKTLGESLDPEIDVYWTGPRVKTHAMVPSKATWYSNFIGRKPTIYHNGDGIGKHLYFQYGADPCGYKESHDPNIFDYLAGIHHKISHYYETPHVCACMDWCWNPDAHDSRESVKRAVEQHEGPGVFEIIEKALPALVSFDTYTYSTPRPQLLDEDLGDMERRLLEVDVAWDKVRATAKNKGEFVRGFGIALGWKRRLVQLRREKPEWLVKEYEAAKSNTVFAVKETGFDESKGDEFLPAEILCGGRFLPGVRDSKYSPRDIKMLEPGDEVSGKFSCRMFPPEKPIRMIVVGMTYERPKESNMTISETTVEVNGNVVWRGEMFKDHYYLPFEIEIPTVAVRRENTFKIRNPGPKVKGQCRPVVHYVVIKK